MYMQICKKNKKKIVFHQIVEEAVKRDDTNEMQNESKT